MKANDSCSRNGDANIDRARLSVLESLGYHSQGQDLRTSLGLLSRRTVGQNSWKLRHLGNPPTVILLFGINAVVHEGTPDQVQSCEFSPS